MLKPAVGICPEGWPFIGIFGFTALLAAILEWLWPAVALWFFCLFSLYFFRDPERVIAEGPDIAVSPADGTVIRIELRRDPFSNKEVRCVSIFMSIFNVHVNRAPVAAKVESIRYFPGKFFNASLDKASTDNERCAWLLRDGDNRSWTMVQIAGLVARRIVCRATQGDALVRGERVGLIRFGSRVDLYLPEGYVPAVQKGARVFGGETIIARRG